MNSALGELLMLRLRMYYREPEALFWTYGFPIILTVSLGLAFRSRPPEQTDVAVEQGPASTRIVEMLESFGDGETFDVEVCDPAGCKDRLARGESAVVVSLTEGDADAEYTFTFDPMRPESRHARLHVDDALQRAAGRADPINTADAEVTEPGSRYVDFLVPGLLGMNLMGSGLWGVGFVATDLRIRKLLKRFTATPMRRSDFLWSLIGARMVFAFPEVLIVLGVGVWMFDIPLLGNPITILIFVLLGGLCFAGLGLLVASRAEKLETVSGLMNLVMLPMWLLSGIFFSTKNFPDFLQPVVKALPLTHLNDALRAVILEGASLWSQWIPMTVLIGVSAVSFVLALKLFKWS